MSDRSAPVVTGASPGRMLREARERQGLHIAALAASIKVAPKKLEMLEADRFDALPDATFARALAQTVCRALKLDPAPVLRLLPPLAGYRLEHVGEGLNAPFHPRSDAGRERAPRELGTSPAVWVTALILLAALGVYLLPPGTLRFGSFRDGAPVATASKSAARPADGAPPGAAAPGSAVEGPTALPATAPDAEAAARTAASETTPAPTGMLQVRTSAESWVEITDSSGRALVSRLIQPGEAIGIDGVPPFKVRIGNAAGTQLVFRGQPTELAAYTRDNVARLELR